MIKNRPHTNAKFDGLADDYDRFRPRYPLELFHRMLLPFKNKKHLSIVDIGAGTGIALEHIVEILGNEQHYQAIDVSSDMIDQGKRKFPDTTWHKGQAEALLPQIGEIDIAICAQSFQWMDRPKLLSIVSQQLRPGGIMAVIQNNRNFEENTFLAAYESLLEAMSPGYSRYYRKFDFKQEMLEAFEATTNEVTFYTHDWTMTIPSEAFLGMSRSSTQAQRAIAAHGEEFLDQLSKLITQHEEDGMVEIRYKSELYVYTR